MKMEAARVSKILANFYQEKRRHMTQECDLESLNLPDRFVLVEAM
jgi:hypothetical protein